MSSDQGAIAFADPVASPPPVDPGPDVPPDESPPPPDPPDSPPEEPCPVEFGLSGVLFGAERVIFGTCLTEVPPGPFTGAFEVYRNGEPVDILWSRNQLLSINLQIAAYDGDIGMGSVSLPGEPDRDNGWWIGDRISFLDPNVPTVIYTGYLFRPEVGRNPDSITELQTTWQLQDLNRQFIGRRISDLSFDPEWPLDYLVAQFKPMIEGSGDPQPTLDDTTWVDTDPSPLFPPKTYNSDGAMDWIADIIKYTGKTVYLGLTDSENAFQLHVHALTDGPFADPIAISDTDLGTADVFQPVSPRRIYETADLKDGVTGRNGIVLVPSIPVGTYGDGGIGLEATLDYGVNEDDLILIVNNVITSGSIPKISYTCDIWNLTGQQVALARAGSLIAITGTVFGITNGFKRISRMTLTVSRDISGNPRPGRWDMALEMDYPFRNPTAIIGYGGQGNQLGALSTYTEWTTTEPVVEDDPAIPVGSFETVTCQLRDDKGNPVSVEGVSITWSVLQDDRTTVHPDYATYDDDQTTPLAVSLTDQSGQAHIVVGRTADTIGANHTVQAEPT